MSRPRPVLKPLSAYWEPPVPVRILVLPLALAVVLIVVSMRLPWHHHDIPGAGFTIVYGIQGANWLLAVAGVSALLVVRFWVLPPGTGARWALSIMAFLTVIGMFADYIDSQDRAAQLNLQAYVGAGFYVGLAAMGCVLAATVLTWILHD